MNRRVLGHTRARMNARSSALAITVVGTVWLIVFCGAIRGNAQQAGRGQASPAAQPPPQTTTPQQYPREQIDGGLYALRRAVRLLSRT